MARAHSAAKVVIDATDQQRLGFVACGPVIGPLATELGLDGVEEITIKDGGLLAWKNLALKDDLLDVEPVAAEGGRAGRA